MKMNCQVHLQNLAIVYHVKTLFKKENEKQGQPV